MKSIEQIRLKKCLRDSRQLWKKWGPYVSERQWGTVREDYSSQGDPWNYITHEMSRSLAYRWGEDGLGGFCDRFQRLVLSFAFWNEKDPFLKERYFGLNPYEGNHGEDVKECYYYLDGTPTHSYMKMLYKYPQELFPYEELIEKNKNRSVKEEEYEIYDTSAFEKDRYFDITIEYAKKSEEDFFIRLEITNRGDKSSSLHILPQLVFRNFWSWDNNPCPLTPLIQPLIHENSSLLMAQPFHLPCQIFNYRADVFFPMYFYGKKTKMLFTNNETNYAKLWNSHNRTPYVKDAFHRHIIGNEKSCNPSLEGTKAALHYKTTIDAKKSEVFFFRLSSAFLKDPLKEGEKIVKMRQEEANDFYRSLQCSEASAEEKLIQRQALSGMLWGKQFYFYDVSKWLKGDNPQAPPPPERFNQRNSHWKHFEAKEIISMPDKWEYPWFAAWDLAFHTVALSLIDIDFSKQQLHTVLQHQYQHPNGQIPAYEWGFSDLNPPVQAWALWRIYQREKKIRKKGDLAFLEVCFLKLFRNFNWWVNKVDKVGNNFFEGGFLGLDNISIIDRSKPLENGGCLEQSDGTGWMSFFSLTMMRIALELSKKNTSFQVMATIFLEHFFFIANAMQKKEKVLGERSINMWDEEDGFFYDVISYPDGRHEKLKVRSFVGIIPLFSLDCLEEKELNSFPSFRDNFHLFMKNHPQLTERFVSTVHSKGEQLYLLSLMTIPQIQTIMQKVISENEFFSSYGVRSLSKYHESHPLYFEGHSVYYEPGVSFEKIKGGNSNWRGPIWFPTNYLLLESLKTLQNALGPHFAFHSLQQKEMTLSSLIKQLQRRLINIFCLNDQGFRPVHGNHPFYKNPSCQDLILFYEHFHGESGKGLGASHQTGWTGLVANLISEI